MAKKFSREAAVQQLVCRRLRSGREWNQSRFFIWVKILCNFEVLAYAQYDSMPGKQHTGILGIGAQGTQLVCETM